jgi:DNA-binding NarL/FixJ family response regulator
MSYRIVHADRSMLFHRGVKSLFAGDKDFEFVDHCSYLEQAFESLETHRPNLLLTATNLYDTRGIL